MHVICTDWREQLGTFHSRRNSEVKDRNQSHFFNVLMLFELGNWSLFLQKFLLMIDQVFLCACSLAKFSLWIFLKTVLSCKVAHVLSLHSDVALGYRKQGWGKPDDKTKVTPFLGFQQARLCLIPQLHFTQFLKSTLQCGEVIGSEGFQAMWLKCAR